MEHMELVERKFNRFFSSLAAIALTVALIGFIDDNLWFSGIGFGFVIYNIICSIFMNKVIFKKRFPWEKKL